MQQHRQFYRQHHHLNLQLDRHHIIRPARVFLPRVGRILVAHTPHSSYPILYPPIHIISHHYLTLLSNSVIIAMFCYQLSLVCLNEQRISHFVLIFTTVSFWNIFPTSKAALNVMTLFLLWKSSKREPFSASHRMCTSFLCISPPPPPPLKMLLRFTENLQTSESNLFNLIPGGTHQNIIRGRVSNTFRTKL